MGGTTSNKTTIAMGVLSMAVGVIPLLGLAGILPRGNAPADAAPSWMGWLIAAVFMGAGLIVIMRGVLNVSDRSGDLPASAPRLARRANDVLGLGIACGMAAMFSWVAFGPGPRHSPSASPGCSRARPDRATWSAAWRSASARSCSGA